MQAIKIQTGLILTLLLFLSCTLTAQDVACSKDHPLFNRMPGYKIEQYKENDFDVYDKFKDSNGKKTSVEGHYYFIQYRINKGEEAASGAQVLSNFINAVTKIGGKVIYETKGDAYFNLINDKKETWAQVEIFNRGGGYRLWIIESAAMEQSIVADPKAMGDDIERTGRVAIYGIYFDTDSYKIKPESEPALKAIAELLKTKSSLNVYVVGHTDMTGNLDHNMKLSENRAKAVVDALVKDYGISAKRLIGKGVGPLSPVSTNKTDEGKLLNRRVELVEQ
jgi:outer membrane protein OmpA-like peptidoglycan-associated protein